VQFASRVQRPRSKTSKTPASARHGKGKIDKVKGTIDFRDLYHELLTKTIGTDSGPSVGPGRRDIGCL
jgi:hypothetical protein